MALAAAGLCLNLAASEKIEIVGDGIQLPKEQSLLERRSSSFDVLADKPNVAGGFIAPPARTPGVADRKLLEELDRKKNWIYLNPYEDDRRTMGLDKLEKEQAPSPLQIEDNEQSSVLERFYRERDNRRSLEESRLEQDRDRERDQFHREDIRSRASIQDRLEMDREFSSRRDDDREFSRELSLNSFIDRGQGTPGAGPGNRDPYERNNFNFGTLAERPRQSPEQEADLKRQEDIRSANFQRLLQPRSITPSIGGVLDPINTQTDPSRRAANPISPERDEGMSFGRGESSVFDSPIFATRERSQPQVSALPDRNLPNSFDIGTRSPASTGFSTPSFSPPPSAPVPSASANPFVLEIPKRKF